MVRESLETLFIAKQEHKTTFEIIAKKQVAKELFQIKKKRNEFKIDLNQAPREL